jgi:hypothetical protein
MKILKYIKYLFVVLLFLEFITHSYINFTIGKPFIDVVNLVIILLIISLIIEKRFFTIILILYAVSICILNFSPVFLSEKIVEKLYYNLFFGRDLSSFVRNNIINFYWLVNPIMNLSFYLSGYILILEAPFRFGMFWKKNINE